MGILSGVGALGPIADAALDAARSADALLVIRLSGVSVGTGARAVHTASLPGSLRGSGRQGGVGPRDEPGGGPGAEGLLSRPENLGGGCG